MRGQVSSIDVDAPPEAVWAVVTDVTRTGEWSPVCHTVRWTDGSTGPAPGARFRGENRIGRVRWARECEVTQADRPRTFAFRTFYKGKESTRWRYEIEPRDGGARVTESYEPVAAPLYVRLARVLGAKRIDADAKRNLEESLRRVKAIVEGG